MWSQRTCGKHSANPMWPIIQLSSGLYKCLDWPWVAVGVFFWNWSRHYRSRHFFPTKSQCQAHTAHQMWWVWWGSRDELNNLTVTWLNGVVRHWCPCCHLKTLAPSQGGGFRQMMEAHTSEERDMDVDVDVCWGPNDAVPSPAFSRDVAIWLFNTLICRYVMYFIYCKLLKIIGII